MKQKHLTIEQRRIIERELNQHTSFKAISRIIDKDPSTISKEVRLNSTIKLTGASGKRHNPCSLRHNCKLYLVCQQLCHYKDPKLCTFCGQCIYHCPDFIEEVCSKLSKPPYVCNGCDTRIRCTLSKRFYDSITANQSYRSRKVESRQGFDFTQTQLDALDQLLYPLIVEQGQSIHHVYIHHQDQIMCSEKTLYNLIDAGLLSVRNIDLPKKVKFRPRKKQKSNFKVDKQCLENRRYSDFIAFTHDHPDQSVVQIDTVEGIKGGKCLLTLHFTNTSFMLAFIRERNDSKSVTAIFNHLYSILGADRFKRLFPILLTDNGSEFSNPEAIEFDSDGQRRTYLFYCEPSSPYQKGACENNHTLIRRILPKGKDMSHLSQPHIDLLMSHVNSYARLALNNKPPHLLFSALYGEAILNKLNITIIHPDEVVFKPSLISSK